MKYTIHADPFSRAFLENRDKTMEERIALGMWETALYQPISFPENCMLPTVGVDPVNSAAWFDYGGGISVDAGRYDTLIEENPADANQLQEIRDQMMDFHTQLRFLRSCPETDQKLWEAKACWGGTWGGHANPDYDRLLHWGTNGIRRYKVFTDQPKNHCSTLHFHQFYSIINARKTARTSQKACTWREQKCIDTAMGRSVCRVSSANGYAAAGRQPLGEKGTDDPLG